MIMPNGMTLRAPTKAAMAPYHLNVIPRRLPARVQPRLLLRRPMTVPKRLLPNYHPGPSVGPPTPTAPDPNAGYSPNSVSRP